MISSPQGSGVQDATSASTPYFGTAALSRRKTQNQLYSEMLYANKRNLKRSFTPLSQGYFSGNFRNEGKQMGERRAKQKQRKIGPTPLTAKNLG
jgi:hypothetical protein